MKSFVLPLCFLFASVGHCDMMGPKDVPAERLIKNAQQYVKDHPKDPDGFYGLGRIQYSIFCSTDPRVLKLYRETPPFAFASAHTSPWEFKDLKPRQDAATIQLVRDAVRNLSKAIVLDKGRDPGLYQLTQACVYEAAAPLASKVQKGFSEAQWRKLALACYVSSYNAAKVPDLKKPTSKHAGTWEAWISVEAGGSVLRLDPQTKFASEIRQHLAAMEKLPPTPITLIVFSLNAGSTLNGLLDRAKTVHFKLDGLNRPQTWTWVKPDTCILVWQPNPRVPITSGRQLFGSATWWMMYKDGYAAMAALDNNGDRWLTGSELRGISVWRDRNQDGTWQQGESVRLDELGIVGLRVRPTGRAGSSLVSKGGIRYRNGRVGTTYDWVVSQKMG